MVAQNLHGKVVIITGASGGIGREIAVLFARAGCRLALSYCHHQSEAQELERACRASGAKDVLLSYLDVADDHSIAAFRDAVLAQFGGIGILINNAGVVFAKSLAEQTNDEIAQQIRINLEGLIKLTKACLPHLRDTIISIGSGAGKSGISHLSTYCATKFGVRGFMQALAVEYPHLRILTVNPGRTATRMTDFHGQPPRDVAKIVFNAARGCYAIQPGSDIDLWNPPEIDDEMCHE